MRHQEADLGGGEKLARALAGTLGEFPEQVFVGPAQEIRLNVGQPQTVARVGKSFNDGVQPGRVDVPLAVALGGEVHQVYDPRQRGIV